MIIDVRGALGNQVLELLVGLARAKNLNKTPTIIRVNTGGRVVETVKVDWLSTLFNLPYPVELSAGSAKQRAWTTDNFKLIANQDLVNSILLLNTPNKNNLTLLHVRGKDRQTASLEDYIKLAKRAGPQVKLIGDDQKLINNIIKSVGFGENISRTPQEDWYTCIGASHIYTSFSSFTVSAALFDPSKRMSFLTKQNSNGPASVGAKEYTCIGVLSNSYFKNAEWI